jgi:hypothetical protein
MNVVVVDFLGLDNCQSAFRQQVGLQFLEEDVLAIDTSDWVNVLYGSLRRI